MESETYWAYPDLVTSTCRSINPGFWLKAQNKKSKLVVVNIKCFNSLTLAIRPDKICFNSGCLTICLIILKVVKLNRFCLNNIFKNIFCDTIAYDECLSSLVLKIMSVNTRLRRMSDNTKTEGNVFQQEKSWNSCECLCQCVLPAVCPDPALHASYQRCYTATTASPSICQLYHWRVCGHAAAWAQDWPGKFVNILPDL